MRGDSGKQEAAKLSLSGKGRECGSLRSMRRREGSDGRSIRNCTAKPAHGARFGARDKEGACVALRHRTKCRGVLVQYGGECWAGQGTAGKGRRRAEANPRLATGSRADTHVGKERRERAGVGGV